MSITDPEIKETKNIKITYDVEQFVTEVAQLAEEEKTKRTQWEAKIDNYTKKRYGIRQKKNFPWVGSANFVLPQIDTDINRLKPQYVNMSYGVSPVCTFEPLRAEDVEPARKREILFDWRMRNHIKFFKQYCLGIDFMLHCGFVLFKTGWKFETGAYTQSLDLADLPEQVLQAIYMPEVDDMTLAKIIAEELQPDLSLEENVSEVKRVVKEFREGKTKFGFEFREKLANRAEVVALNPREDVIFPVETCDIQDASFIEHRFWMSVNDMKRAMKDDRYSTHDDYTISGWTTAQYRDAQSDNLRSIRDGYTYSFRSDDRILVSEIHTWFDVNGDGIDERVIATFPTSSPSNILRFIENPYDHGQFPFVVVRREINDAEILSSRGIAALDDDFQTGISTIFNQDIDAGTIATTPTIVARRNSVKNLRNLRYVPGQVVETENGSADYQLTQNTNLGQASRFANMQYLKAWANDRVGNIQAAISQSNNQPGQGTFGTKTAKEVSAIEAISGQNQSLDLIVFQQQMADLYHQIDSLYFQFGDEIEDVVFTGAPPVKISRKEIRGRFNIVPNGKIDNANPTVRAQKTLTMFQVFNGDPYVRQDQLRKMLLDDWDVRVSQRLIKTPQEMQQAQMMMVQDQNDKLRVALNMQKAKDLLAVQKEAMLTPITGRKYAAN